MNTYCNRRSLLAGVVCTSTLLAGCSSSDQAEQTEGETNQERSDSPVIGSDVDLEAGLLVGTQLPDPFTLNYDSETPDQLAGSPSPTAGYANRFVNQDASGDDIVFVESVIGRYEDIETATRGLESTLSEFDQTTSDTAESGDAIGDYHIFSYENESGYTTTALFNRYGNILHGVLTLGQTAYREEVTEFGQLQFLQVQRFDSN